MTGGTSQEEDTKSRRTTPPKGNYEGRSEEVEDGTKVERGNWGKRINTRGLKVRKINDSVPE